MTSSFKTLTLLLALLPVACGERSIVPQSPSPDAQAALDGAVPTHFDASASTADGLAPPAPDVLSLPDAASPPAPCCQAPVCVNKGSYSEGWSDPCKAQPLKLGFCSGCEIGCKDCGPGCKENGWYTFCPTFKLVRACACKPCVPRCLHIGSNSEGWYDGCTGKLIAWATCGACQAICHDPAQPAVGLPQHRYYSSCDTTTPLTKTLCIP